MVLTKKQFEADKRLAAKVKRAILGGHLLNDCGLLIPLKRKDAKFRSERNKKAAASRKRARSSRGAAHD